MYIIKAAVKYSDGEILEGRNYGRIIYLGNQLGRDGEKVFGFLTTSGEFVLPPKAAKIAAEAGQIGGVIDKLEPEDLWPDIAEV